MESPRNRSYKLVNDYQQKRPPYGEAEDGDDRRQAQRETADFQRRYPAGLRCQYGVNHPPDSVVYYLKEPRRRVTWEPADHHPRYYEPEHYVVRVAHCARKQQTYAVPERLQYDEEKDRLRHQHRQPASLRARSVAASTPSYTAAAKPAFSIAAKAAAVVPPGVVTSSRI